MFIFNENKTSLINTEYVQSFMIFESNDDGDDHQMNHKFVKVAAILPAISSDGKAMREIVAEFNTNAEAVEWLTRMLITKKEKKKK